VRRGLLGLLFLVGLVVTVAISPTAESASGCPATWRGGWQKLADQIRAHVYCPSWMPSPLDGKIGGPRSNGRYVDPDRSYLVSFVWQETSKDGGSEVHVNFRGYPGRTRIPLCKESEYTGGKIHRFTVPCFSDPRGRRTVAGITFTVYTVNQDADQWHVLYAWRSRGSLYTVSEHVAPPYASATRVMQNLDRIMRSLQRLEPRGTTT
jgi:hypothetical protein